MQGTRSSRRRLGAGFLLVACALCVFASLATPAGRAEASASGTLVLNGPDTAPAAGDTFAVTLDLNGAAGVHKVGGYVLYNPNVVQVVDADPGTSGTQVLPGPFPGGGSVTANSAAGGSIQYEYTLAGSEEASGSGTIATVQFRALRNGDAGLQWGTVQVVDGGGTAGALSTVAASVNVGGSTTAAATDTPSANDTPPSTSTPIATDTASPTAAATGTSSSTATGVPSTSPTSTRTATVTRTPGATVTPRPSSTPRITVI